MDEKIKLNLGCGSNYTLGYINIDKFNKNIADIICDINDLPFRLNSVDLIQANQIIEHFDYIHCKYILSEWFQVLKPGGELIIETPDLKKTYKKFISSDLETQITTLQWIYGIESEGLQHKTGFTINLLKNLLIEIGFDRITKEKQKTHTYEYGFRLSCKKPIKYNKNQFFASFRKRLKTNLKMDDSYILIPLEDWLKTIYTIYDKFKENKKICIKTMISEAVICNPVIPLTFIEEGVNSKIIEGSEFKKEIDFLKYLTEIGFHKKVFSLWLKNRKEIGELEKEFQKFISQLKKLILDILNYTEDCSERLNYIFELDPTDIELFDYNLILLKAKKEFDTGIKNFYQRNFSKALVHFLKSSKINPDYYLVFLNIGRLGCILKFDSNKIIAYYETALKLIENKEIKEKIQLELKNLGDTKENSIQIEPFTEEY